MTKEEAIQKGFKEFIGEGYTVMAHPKSCFFCKNCIEILYDFTNGPYMFFCDKIDNPDEGLKGICDKFEPDKE